MEISEKELEDMICLKNQDLLKERGLNCFHHHKIIRQLNLGVYGIPDLIGITVNKVDENESIDIYVYELKKGVIDMSALSQVARYINGIVRFIITENLFLDKTVTFSPVLIGSSIDLTGGFIYTSHLIENLEIFTYNININGVYFEHLDTSDYSPANLDVLGFGSLSKSIEFDWIENNEVLQIEN